MIKYNYNFAKPDENGMPLFGPMPLCLHIQHHEEWDEDIFDPETGEPTGEKEHHEYDWTEEKVIVCPSASDFAQAGYLHLIDQLPGDAPAGKHYERTGKIEAAQGAYAWQYVLVDDPPPPPRVFSKLYLELALFKAGLLQAVDAFIDTQTITNEQGETMPLRRAYSTALTFSEDNEYFATFLAQLKTALRIDDATVEAILDAAVERGM